MARRRSSVLARTSYVMPRPAPAPIVRVSMPRAAGGTTKPKKKHHTKRRHAGTGMSLGTTLAGATIAGGMIGLAEKTGLMSKLPEIPYVGRKGSIALLAYAWARWGGGGQIARDVAIAAATMAAYQLGKEQKIDGEGEAYLRASAHGGPHKPGARGSIPRRARSDRIPQSHRTKGTKMELDGLDTMGMDTVGEDIVGAMVRSATGRGGGRVRSTPLWLKGVSAQGVSKAAEELDYLPFTTTQLTTAAPTGAATAFPQRPFRGERLIASAFLQPGGGGPPVVASDFVIITPAIYVGAVQVGASQGDAPLSTWSSNAFGVRLSMPSAGQGTRVYIPYATLLTLGAGDKVNVAMTLIGRAVR
jgi:hypothetical protein